MAPSLTETISLTTEQVQDKLANTTLTEKTYPTPLKLSGALDQFKSFDVTPVIGREFQEGNLAEWLRAENSDELLRELAITSKSISNYKLCGS